MEDRTWMKKCCEHCPFKRETTLTLHPDRAEDFAYMAANPYTDFPCHKTADVDEEIGFVHGEHSFTCHGFKAIQINENSQDEPGFEFDSNAFSEADEMIEYHEMAWAESGRT